MIKTTETYLEQYGKKCLEFEFLGRACRLILPDAEPNGKWLLKTEYANAFPDFEKRMLELGYHVAFIPNESRWMLPSDIDAKAEFAKMLTKEFGLNKKCMTVGMSCGGLISVYFAAKYPEYVACMYLDAPVMNLLSTPAGIGKKPDGDIRVMLAEFTQHTGMTISDLINYRNHPIDNAPKLLSADIPIMLISGDADSVVPYHENGLVLERLYKEGRGKIEVIMKPGGDHHPHGLPDNSPIVEFAKKYY